MTHSILKQKIKALLDLNLGPVILGNNKESAQRMELEDKLTTLFHRKMSDAWHGAIAANDKTSFNDWFNKHKDDWFTLLKEK